MALVAHLAPWVAWRPFPKGRHPCAAALTGAAPVSTGRLAGVCCFFRPELGADVLAVRHMQQAGHLADGVHLVLVRACVRVGDLPHGFNELDLLVLREMLVQLAGEALVVVGGSGGGCGLFQQALQFIVT